MMMQVDRTRLMMAAIRGFLVLLKLPLVKGADLKAKKYVSYALFMFPLSDTGQIHDVVAEIEDHCYIALVWPFMWCWEDKIILDVKMISSSWVGDDLPLPTTSPYHPLDCDCCPYRGSTVLMFAASN
jgi:hypothetical protein